MQVNMLEAKSQLSKLVKAAQAGEEVIIAHHGVPAVRLVAVESADTAPSLADELSGLRALLRDDAEEWTPPSRQDRGNAFLPTLDAGHVAD